MFFLLTNISIGKYYPDIMTQFILGVVCYAIVFFILKDFITAKNYEAYKYYLGTAIIIDTTFLLYQYKYNSIKTVGDQNNSQSMAMDTITPIDSVQEVVISPSISKTTLCSGPSGKLSGEHIIGSVTKENIKKSTMSTELDVSFSSDINDYKISHDIFPTDNSDQDESLPIPKSDSNKISGYDGSNYVGGAVKSMESNNQSISFTM
jgi:hypothetical protein